MRTRQKEASAKEDNKNANKESSNQKRPQDGRQQTRRQKETKMPKEAKQEKEIISKKTTRAADGKSRRQNDQAKDTRHKRWQRFVPSLVSDTRSKEHQNKVQN